MSSSSLRGGSHNQSRYSNRDDYSEHGKHLSQSQRKDFFSSNSSANQGASSLGTGAPSASTGGVDGVGAPVSASSSRASNLPNLTRRDFKSNGPGSSSLTHSKDPPNYSSPSSNPRSNASSSGSYTSNYYSNSNAYGGYDHYRSDNRRKGGDSRLSFGNYNKSKSLTNSVPHTSSTVSTANAPTPSSSSSSFSPSSSSSAAAAAVAAQSGSLPNRNGEYKRERYDSYKSDSNTVPRWKSGRSNTARFSAKDRRNGRHLSSSTASSSTPISTGNGNSYIKNSNSVPLGHAIDVATEGSSYRSGNGSKSNSYYPHSRQYGSGSSYYSSTKQDRGHYASKQRFHYGSKEHFRNTDYRRHFNRDNENDEDREKRVLKEREDDDEQKEEDEEEEEEEDEDEEEEEEEVEEVEVEEEEEPEQKLKVTGDEQGEDRTTPEVEVEEYDETQDGDNEITEEEQEQEQELENEQEQENEKKLDAKELEQENPENMIDSNSEQRKVLSELLPTTIGTPSIKKELVSSKETTSGLGTISRLSESKDVQKHLNVLPTDTDPSKQTGAEYPLPALEDAFEKLKRGFESAVEKEGKLNIGLKYSMAKPITNFSEYSTFNANYLSFINEKREVVVTNLYNKSSHLKRKTLKLWTEYNHDMKVHEIEREKMDQQLRILHPPDDESRKEIDSSDLKKQMQPSAVGAVVNGSATHTNNGSPVNFPSDGPVYTSRRSSRRHGDLVTTEAEFQEILLSLGKEEDLDPLTKAQKVAADIPDMILDPIARNNFKFMDSNNIVHDKVQWTQRVKSDFYNTFSEREHELFSEGFCLYPKRFGAISRHMGGLRSASDCVVHYYMTKKAINYKQLLAQYKKKANRKGRRVKSVTRKVAQDKDKEKGKGVEQDQSISKEEKEITSQPIVLDTVVNQEKESLTPSGSESTPQAEIPSVATVSSQLENKKEEISTGGARKKRAAPPTSEGKQREKEKKKSKRELAPKVENVAEGLPDQSQSQFAAQYQQSQLYHQEYLQSQQQSQQHQPVHKEHSVSNFEVPAVHQNAFHNTYAAEVKPGLASNAENGTSYIPQSQASFSVSTGIDDVKEKKKAISSYWSITEANAFPVLLQECGTRWTMIADKLGTKSATMVRNYFQRNAEKNNWIPIAEVADAKMNSKSKQTSKASKTSKTARTARATAIAPSSSSSSTTTTTTTTTTGMPLNTSYDKNTGTSIGNAATSASTIASTYQAPAQHYIPIGTFHNPLPSFQNRIPNYSQSGYEATNQSHDHPYYQQQSQPQQPQPQPQPQQQQQQQSQQQYYSPRMANILANEPVRAYQSIQAEPPRPHLQPTPSAPVHRSSIMSLLNSDSPVRKEPVFQPLQQQINRAKTNLTDLLNAPSEPKSSNQSQVYPQHSQLQNPNPNPSPNSNSNSNPNPNSKPNQNQNPTQNSQPIKRGGIASLLSADPPS